MKNSDRRNTLCALGLWNVGKWGEVQSFFGADGSSTRTPYCEKIHVPADELVKVRVALYAGHVQCTGTAGAGGSSSRQGRQEGMGGSREEGQGQEKGLSHHDDRRRDEYKKVLPV